MAETRTASSSNKRPRPHGPDADSSTASDPGPKRPAVRKRAPLACEECRTRKRRCDGAVPICGGCTKRMSCCVYLAELQEKAWQHDMIQSLRNRLKELEQSEQQQQQQQQQQHPQQLQQPAAAAGPRNSPPTPGITNTSILAAQPCIVASGQTPRPPPPDLEPAAHGGGNPPPPNDSIICQPPGGAPETETLDNTAEHPPAPDYPVGTQALNLHTDPGLGARSSLSPSVSTRGPLLAGHGILAPPPSDPGTVRPGVAHLAAAAGSPTPTFPDTLTTTSGDDPLPLAAVTAMPVPLTGGGSCTTPYGSPSGVSGRLEPSSVERLMRPIDRAISQSSIRSSIVAPSAGGGGSVHGMALTQAPCTCDRLLGAAHWSLPLRRHADDLVRLYFTRVHRMYPILHRPTFMRQYSTLWEPAPAGPASCSGLCRQKSLDKTFPAMVNAVFALATLFASNPAEQNSARAATFFNMTQQVDLLDIIDEEVGIELVQLLLLMGFYLQSTEKFSKCWNITGLAIRMAQNMGLQLSPTDARRRGLLTSSPTQLESEMRVRVWYGCVLLDREISMSFGRPLMINSGATDTLTLPEAIDDERLNEEAGGRWNSQPSNCPSLLESYIQTIKLYDILGQVLDREDSKDGGGGGAAGRMPAADRPPMANSDTQSLLDLDTMIMEWRDALPVHLQYDPSSDRDRPDGALTPESSIPPCDFLAQAKRLHTRFLHVRVLILRPALEHLFQKQRHIQPSARARSSPVARVQDLMLSDIAAQCVLTADALVRCLDTHIRSQSLVAWWYNIGYLHTAGSTLLMGRLCSFNDAVVRREALTASWELCLQSLARYITLSSIADKSVYLLQESARRLLPEKDQHPPIPLYSEPLPPPRPGPVPTDMAGPRPSSMGLQQYTTLPPGMVDGCQLQQSVDIFPGSGQVMTAGPPQMGDGGGGLGTADMWVAGDLSAGASYWPFMPFLSQLEALPEGFDMGSLE